MHEVRQLLREVVFDAKIILTHYVNLPLLLQVGGETNQLFVRRWRQVVVTPIKEYQSRFSVMKKIKRLDDPSLTRSF